MLKNYFIVALRSFRRNKIFSLINLIGLSLGISAALVIYLVVHYDFNFDTFHKDRDRIYRIVSNLHFPGQIIRNSGVPLPLPDAAKNELTGIESSAAFYTYDDAKVAVPRANGTTPVVYKRQLNVIFADENYFSLFSYKWLAGSPAASLHEPFRVVLSESRAKTYFPGHDISQAVGQTIIYNDSIKATVSGIVKDLDRATDFTFKEFISRSTIFNSGLKNDIGWSEWGSVSSASQFFVKLVKNVSSRQVEKQLHALHNKYASQDFMKTEHLLQPLADLHFYSEYDNFDQRQAHKPVLYGLLAVAVFLLLLGCINFINLTTAQAAQRAKEIGIRKTLGSSRGQLIFQFLSETFLLTLLSTLLSVALAPWILKVFADFVPPGLHVDILRQPHIIWFLLSLIVIVSILSGFYPALILSRFLPVMVLKNQAYAGTGKTRNAWLRKSLTVLQFVIAQFFILATMVVGKQIHYSLNKDMGFRKDAIINLEAPWNDSKRDNRFMLLNKIRSVPEVEMASLAGSPPAAPGYTSGAIKFNDGKKETETTIEMKSADSTYFDIYKLKLVAGKLPPPSDTVERGYLVNETYARLLGFKDPKDLLGKNIERGTKQIPITGVLVDFHFKSLHAAIKPLLYSSISANYGTYHILLKPNGKDGSTWKNGIGKIEKAWKEVFPEYDFKYRFFDESIAGFYKSEQNISRLLKWATGLAILISCLGLLGLVVYTTNQRTKEIGVRKILGASLVQVVTLLSADFLALVLFAFVIAAPLAWWAMHKWLEDFAYKTTVSWWLFLLCGLLILLIALITLSIQTIRAAMTNPVKSLRTE